MPIFGKNIHYFLSFLLLAFFTGCNTTVNTPPEADASSQLFILNSPDNHQLRKHLQILAGPDSGYAIGEIVQPELQGQFLPFTEKTFEPQSQQTYWGMLKKQLHDYSNRRGWSNREVVF